MIVGATVNYSDIAERLSEMVANVTDKAARAANILIIYRTRNLRELFSDLYAQVFLFYRDAIQWYAKSKVARAFESFNANLVKPYEKAATKIESLLTEMYREANVANSAQIAVFFEDIEDRLRNQRGQYTDRDDLVFAGRQGRRLLLSMHESADLQREVFRISESQRMEPTENMSIQTNVEGLLSRVEARTLGSQLQKFVVGSEGPSLFKDGMFWLPEPRICSMLSDWISPDTLLSTLWIGSPSSSPGFSGSRAAALTAVVTAWDSEMPVISHFCGRPYFGDLAEGCTVEEVGLIGLVYSLVAQLLQFNVKDDNFQVSEERFAQLNGSRASWPGALLLFKELLRTTPHVTRCVIDGLNGLSSSDGADWCGDLLQTLMEHRKSFAKDFKILLTTTGQSRVLPDYICREDTVVTQEVAREVIRGGRWLNMTKR